MSGNVLGGAGSIAAERDRAHGALLGLAIGDALGMPTQDLAYEVVRHRYGLLAGFEAAPDDNWISRGMPPGRVTDDTDQAVIVGRLLVAGDGHLDPGELAVELLAWQRRMESAGSLDLLGPSTRAALDQVAHGVSPLESGRHGATNGAAMRIAPVGICVDVSGPDDRAGIARLVERVAEVSRVTHNTGLAIAGASAVAAAVSAGISGAGLPGALQAGVAAAERGAAFGEYAAGADVAERIRWALSLVEGRSAPGALEVVSRLVGTSVATQESVPAALALASLLSDDDPWLVLRAAASLGGDSDTVAAMAGAVCGAVAGARAFPMTALADLSDANPELDLGSLADDLYALRGASAVGAAGDTRDEAR